jgi:hypothetical protein
MFRAMARFFNRQGLIVISHGPSEIALPVKRRADVGQTGRRGRMIRPVNFFDDLQRPLRKFDHFGELRAAEQVSARLIQQPGRFFEGRLLFLGVSG